MINVDPIIRKEEARGPGCIERPTFISESVQAEFDENGYVVFPGFIDKTDMAALEGLYIRFSSSVNTGFHVTNWVKDSDYSREAHEKISKLLAGRLKGILESYKPVLGCFAVKETGQENVMGLHQDWSVTDESEFCGISIWIPLVDVAEDSGSLRMLKGSHRLFSNIRGQKIKNQLDAIPAETIHKYLTSVPMKAGDMLVLHHRLVHCSGSALQRRIAVIMAMVPQEAPVRHFLANTSDPSGKLIKAYTCPDDFYVFFDIESLPSADLMKEDIEQTDFVVTEAMIVDHYSK